jgi:hypothetical protein
VTRLEKLFPAIFAIALSLAVSGCSNDYWIRSDSIYFSHGDAVRSNAAVQIPDPWPARSANTNIPMDPVKATRAIDCYRIGQKPADQLGAYSSSFRLVDSGGSGAANEHNCEYYGMGSQNASPVNDGSTPPMNKYENRDGNLR